MNILSFRVLTLSVIAAILGQPASATGFKHVLTPGRYKIDVIVENPKDGSKRTIGQLERCIEPQKIAEHTIFEMFSKSPASGCPAYEICAGEFRTGFIAQCLKGSAASAIGMFALEPESFRGRIEVKGPDDRLTDIEIQYGERIGDCIGSSLQQTP
jgi:hypothetical protein